MKNDFNQTPISPDDLVPMNAFVRDFPIVVDMVYAQADHPRNKFGQLYHPEAGIMWVHKDLALVTLHAAKWCQQQHGWTFKIDDCLRPIEAQAEMGTKGFDPSLVSTPGAGGHPRAMAIDIEPLHQNGQIVPMGVPFDYFVENPDEYNPAARDHKGEGWYFGARLQVAKDRLILENSMLMSAEALGIPLLPLKEEVWDFRFVPEHFNRFKPLSDQDLHPYQRLMNPDVRAVQAILNEDYPPAVRAAVEDVKTRLAEVYSHIDYDKRGNAYFCTDKKGQDIAPALDCFPK